MAVRSSGSKYSDLPGIDTEPDVYETTEVEEKPVQQNGFHPDDESVELLDVDTESAYKQFQGKYLDSSGSDFSEHIGRKVRKGYASKTEYEMLGEGMAKETPEQKFNRLQHEMRELAEELDQIKSTVQDEKKEGMVSPVALAQEVKVLQQQLQELHIEKMVGKVVLSGSSTPHGVLSERLHTQIQAFKTSDGKSAKPASKDKDADSVTYELFYKPEHAKFNQLSKMSELEQRLQKLETVLGDNPSHISAITADLETNEKSLLSAVSALQAKMALLDTSHVEHIDARLQGILHHVTQLSEQKEQVENAAQQTKVSELFDLLNKWDCVVDVVPDLIKRLQVLKDLHGEASHFGQSLVQLGSAQSSITSQLKTQGNLLTELETGFTNNAAAIEANCTKVEERVNALVDKFERKGR